MRVVPKSKRSVSLCLLIPVCLVSCLFYWTAQTADSKHLQAWQDGQIEIAALQRTIAAMKTQHKSDLASQSELFKSDLLHSATQLENAAAQLTLAQSGGLQSGLNQKAAPDPEFNSASHKSDQRPRAAANKLKEPYFCTKSASDNKKWQKNRKNLVVAPNGGDARGSYQVDRPPQWFCDKLQNSLLPWKTPKLTVNDLAVGIFVGEMLRSGQVVAQRDTWLSRIPASYMFAGTSDPRIPIHGFEKYKLQPDYVSKQTTQLVNLYAMKELYEKEPDKKWYMIYGCDNYVNVDYLLLELDKHDHTKPLWLGAGTQHAKVPDFIQMKKHPKSVIKGGSKGSHQWVTGSNSWIVSNQVMKAFAEYIGTFIDDPDYNFRDTWNDKMCFCPDKVAGLVFQLLGFQVTHFKEPAKFAWNSVDALQNNHYDVGGNIVYHYVSPRKMLLADQRVQHEKLDRLVNAGPDAAESVVQFARDTIDHEFRALRKLQMSTKWLATSLSKFGKKKEFRVHWGNKLYPHNQYDDIPDTYNASVEAESWQRKKII